MINLTPALCRSLRQPIDLPTSMAEPKPAVSTDVPVTIAGYTVPSSLVRWCNSPLKLDTVQRLVQTITNPANTEVTVECGFDSDANGAYFWVKRSDKSRRYYSSLYEDGYYAYFDLRALLMNVGGLDAESAIAFTSGLYATFTLTH